MNRVVVVGASLAGLRAAEVLRGEGFAGPVTLVGDEPHRPYDRPPLSKQVLTGTVPVDGTTLRAATNDALALTWEVGVAAVGLDLARREVTLDDGRRLPFDGLVIATGASARTLPGTQDRANVWPLRTLDDAVGLVAALDAGPARVAVVGAGFIGCEVAAACRQRGLAVTVVEPLDAPLVRVLGTEIGGVVADLHRDHGVDLRLGVGVSAVEGEDFVAERLVLSDGSVLDVDVVVVGIGVVPNTGWLEGSGLSVDDGVVCDETTVAAPGVVAAGDVARWPNPRYGGELMRVEHWEHALNMGAHAARRLLDVDGPGDAFSTVPWFWSDQYDRKIQLAGRVRPSDEVAVLAGSLAERRFCALYGRDGVVTGVLAMNMPAQVVRYRRQLATDLAWTDALEAVADGGSRPT